MQYLISVIDDGQADAGGSEISGTPEEAAAIDVFNEKLQDNDCWVFAGGLGYPNNATTIDTRGESTVITDGPYVESKEFMAGFWIIEAPNLDVALRLATEGSRACNRKIEVRPFLPMHRRSAGSGSLKCHALDSGLSPRRLRPRRSRATNWCRWSSTTSSRSANWASAIGRRRRPLSRLWRA